MLTEKGDFASESLAAVAGGVTTVFDMPNTNPQTTTIEAVEQKAKIASEKCLCNYGFFIGATNENVDVIKNLDPKSVAGVKIFMGISTGGMLVNSKQSLENIFASSKVPVVTHNEDEEMIKANTEEWKKKFPEGQIPISEHMFIRSSDSCYKCTSYVIDLAKKYGTQLHVLHVSTKKEIALFEHNVDIENKKITAEVCPNYLWFDDRDYERLGAKIKCNPAIKKEKSRENLLKGLADGYIDTVASDHSPHLLSQKEGDALTAASGIPSIQYTLPMMLQLAKKGNFSREQVVEAMCHNPAKIFKIEKRGYIRKGYYADLVIVSPDDPYTISESDLLYKCGWSPMVGEQLQYKVTQTFVNGNLVYDEGSINGEKKGQRVTFDR